MAVLTLFIAGLVAIILWVIFFVEWYDCDFYKSLLIAATICTLSCVFTIVHIGNISDETKWENAWKTNIIALKDNSDIEGKIGGGIFVISGYINEETYYYCMESTEEGNHMIKIPSTNAYIKETDDQTPSIIKKHTIHIDKRYDFWMPSNPEEKYIIYVPKGTVDTSYKVDMK